MQSVAVVQQTNVSDTTDLPFFGVVFGALRLFYSGVSLGAGNLWGISHYRQTSHLTGITLRSFLSTLLKIIILQGAAGEGKLGHNQYDRALLATVLGEIPDQKMALTEIFESLKPGRILSVTEVIADPHFQRRDSVTRAANSVGFVEKEFFGHSLSYTINFEKP